MICIFSVTDTCSLSFFKKNRPENVKVIADLPHKVCLCSYHANFIDAVNALKKYVPNVRSYDNGFIQQFLCVESSMDCWYGQCDNCTGITVPKIIAFLGDTPLDLNVSWTEWKKTVEQTATAKKGTSQKENSKSETTSRFQKKEETGPISELIAHISALSSQFLVHSFNKREQSEAFNLIDRPRALDEDYAVEALLQIDFAENFVCASQDEIQSAHWNQKQISLFTTAFYHNKIFKGKVFVSDNTDHTKFTIVPYLWKLVSSLPSSCKILKIWSDGPTSQFKNKYMAAVLSLFEKKFSIKIIWNYFVASHGKGCVDGFGAMAKTVVRQHIRARDIIVNNAFDFVKAYKMTPSKIDIEEVTTEQMEQINTALQTVDLFSKTRPIPNILSAHQIQIINGKTVAFNTSKQGYSS